MSEKERRNQVLTPDDIAAIGETFDQRVIRLFESIGYDITSPAARAGIREDHSWVRDFRTGSERVKLGALIAAVGSIGSGLAWLAWHGFKLAVRM